MFHVKHMKSRLLALLIWCFRWSLLFLLCLAAPLGVAAIYIKSKRLRLGYQDFVNPVWGWRNPFLWRY